MTTVDLYKKHKAGEVSREKFLYEVRRDAQLPWIISVTSYDDAIKILKNKGIITETKIEELSPDTKFSAHNKALVKAGNAYQKVGNSYEKDPLERQKRYNQTSTFAKQFDPQTKPKLKAIFGSTVKNIETFKNSDLVRLTLTTLDDEEIIFDISKTSYKGPESAGSIPQEVVRKLKTAIKYVQDHELANALNEAKQLEGVYGHNPSAEVTLYPNFDTVNYTQLIRGMKFELAQMDEITDANMLLAKKMALKKLSKDPMAYRELVVANQNAVTEMDKTLKMKEVKKGDLVDKANGMKVIKKDAPAAANKSKKFTNKVEKMKQMTQTPKKVKGVEVMEVPGKEKVMALKEAILREFENNGPVEQISKGARVMTRDKKKVGVVDKIEHDTATVKLDDGTMEHVQLNVLTARDVPAKEQSKLEKMPDIGARAQNYLSNTVKADREGPEPESKPNRLKNLKERLKKALKKEIEESEILKNPESGVAVSVQDPAGKAIANRLRYTQKVPGNITPLGKI